MSFTAAFTALAGLTVTGITLKDNDEIPHMPLPSGDLPMMFPVFDENDRLPAIAEHQGFEANDLRASMHFWHRCHVAPTGFKTPQSDIVALLDTYLGVLADSPDLSGAVNRPLKITDAKIGEWYWSTTAYAGFSVALLMVVKFA